MPYQVTKHEFRQWLDAIDTYFSAAQHFEYPEVVLDNVRRFEGEITQLNWAGIMAAANTDVPRNKKIDEWVAKGKSGDFMGVHQNFIYCLNFMFLTLPPWFVYARTGGSY